MTFIDKILQPQVQNFITKAIHLDSTTLAFKKNPFSFINYPLLINQVVAKKKSEKKLPTWFSTKNIVYPPSISIEQSSSETTALYKSKLVSGKNCVDLSGGFGVDTYYFSKVFTTVYHCEINSELSKIVTHNFSCFNVKNTTFINENSTDFLQKSTKKFSCIYIDPSRRSTKKGKVFLLEDCEPNVVKLLPFYLSFTTTLLIKTAPILDISSGLKALKFVKNIHIIAVQNEVKELLWEINNEYSGEVSLFAVNIEKTTTNVTKIPFLDTYKATYSLPQFFLYEPNNALLKTGKFDAISTLFNVDKLHKHSHLYTSTEKQNFQGRIFKIKQQFIFNKKNNKTYLLNQKMNITSRNFPLSTNEIKKRFKILDGGIIYAFFTTNLEGKKIVLICEKA